MHPGHSSVCGSVPCSRLLLVLAHGIWVLQHVVVPSLCKLLTHPAKQRGACTHSVPACTAQSGAGQAVCLVLARWAAILCQPNSAEPDIRCVLPTESASMCIWADAIWARVTSVWLACCSDVSYARGMETMWDVFMDQMENLTTSVPGC